MAIDVGDDTVGTGDTQCLGCQRLYFKAEGCKFCWERIKAAAAVRTEPVSEWWLAIPYGTTGYSSPNDAANGRSSVSLDPGIYKYLESQHTWKGFAIRVATSERFGDVWVLQTLSAGVHKRKSRAKAERIMQEL